MKFQISAVTIWEQDLEHLEMSLLTYLVDDISCWLGLLTGSLAGAPTLGLSVKAGLPHSMMFSGAPKAIVPANEEENCVSFNE